MEMATFAKYAASPEKVPSGAWAMGFGWGGGFGGLGLRAFSGLGLRGLGLRAWGLDYKSAQGLRFGFRILLKVL